MGRAGDEGSVNWAQKWGRAGDKYRSGDHERQPTSNKVLAAVIDILAGHGRILLGAKGHKLLLKLVSEHGFHSLGIKVAWDCHIGKAVNLSRVELWLYVTLASECIWARWSSWTWRACISVNPRWPFGTLGTLKEKGRTDRVEGGREGEEGGREGEEGGREGEEEGREGEEGGREGEEGGREEGSGGGKWRREGEEGKGRKGKRTR